MDIEKINYRSYTDARRQRMMMAPLGLGPKTSEQIVAGFLTFLILIATRSYWGEGVGPAALALLVGGPIAVMSFMPKIQYEGRTAAQIVGGWALLFNAQRHRTINGKPLRNYRPYRSTTKILVRR